MPVFYILLQGSQDIYDHEISIEADSYLPVDDTNIPTGEWHKSCGTWWRQFYRLWVPGNRAAQQGDTPGPGEPRHSRALTHGHSPTAPEQSEQSQMLVTGSVTSPRPGDGIDQDSSRERRQEQREMGPEASGMQGCNLSPSGTSRRQVTHNTEPTHVPLAPLGQHFPAGQSIIPRAIVPNQRGSLSTLRAESGLRFVCFASFSSIRPYHTSLLGFSM